MDDSVTMALQFIRLRANELCLWLKTPGMQPFLRDRSRDVIIRMIPLEFLRQGASCSVAILLALLRIYLGCRIKPKVAVTGVVTLSGKILGVGEIVAKVRKALEYGAELVVVPKCETEKVKKGILEVEVSNKVRFVDNVVDFLHYTIEGKLLSLNY